MCDIMLRYYMSKVETLPGDYIAGFVDGEGCFALTLRRDIRHERKTKPIYYSWKAMFAIVLRNDDFVLLEKIKDALGCGSISFTKNKNQARYQVGDLNELKDKIMPFFNKYPLLGKKKDDFVLWSEAVNILHKYKINRKKIVERGQRGFTKTIWDKNDIKKLIEIQKKMSPYKAKRTSWKWLDKALELGREK